MKQLPHEGSEAHAEAREPKVSIVVRRIFVQHKPTEMAIDIARPIRKTARNFRQYASTSLTCTRRSPFMRSKSTIACSHSPALESACKTELYVMVTAMSLISCRISKANAQRLNCGQVRGSKAAHDSGVNALEHTSRITWYPPW